jgi:hypothetical protein
MIVVSRLRWMFLAGALACSRAQPALVVPADLPWESFRWVTAVYPDYRLERAAFVLPTPIGSSGRRSLLQLDLAASGNMPFGYPGPRVTAPLAMKGRLHGLASSAASLELAPSPSDTTPLTAADEIGTLGQPRFERTPLVIDYRGMRMATLGAGAGLPASLERAAAFVPLESRAGRYAFALEMDGRAVGTVDLDTGLSPFPLWVTRALWTDLTGRTGSESDNLVRRLPSEGGELVMVGASAARSLRASGVDLGKPMVWFLRDGPQGAALERWPWRVDGIAGNLLFADRFLLIVDLGRTRLGLVRRN